MTHRHECRHEWKMNRNWGQCKICSEFMSTPEIERRLNDYERLKAACEVLSVEKAMTIRQCLAIVANEYWVDLHDLLGEYANILEGK